MQQAISWMTFFNFSDIIPHQPCVLLCHFSLPYFRLIPTPQTKRVSQCPLTYSCLLTSLSLNANMVETDFPIPTLKQVHLRRGELSYDKDYTLLKPQRNKLVLDFPNNGGLCLCSQYLKNVILHSVIAALEPHFHFEQCPADGGV